jgi:hypothetical protein
MPSQPNIPVSYSTLRTKVHKKVGKEVCSNAISFLKSKDIKLWGLNKSSNFLEKCFYLTLFKDIENIGFISLLNSIKSWYQHTIKSISHNIKVIRSYLAFMVR